MVIITAGIPNNINQPSNHLMAFIPQIETPKVATEQKRTEAPDETPHSVEEVTRKVYNEYFIYLIFDHKNNHSR